MLHGSSAHMSHIWQLREKNKQKYKVITGPNPASKNPRINLRIRRPAKLFAVA
jgi:hypothetical protein